jgi:putative transcriptional regulator
VALATAVGVLSHAAVPPRLAPQDLAIGRMLIATRQVGGPFFSRSVVLLLDHDKRQGAVGLIVNRRSKYTLEMIVKDLGDARLAQSPLHLGGPVSPETVQVAWRSDKTPDGARRVLDDLHTSARAKVLEALIEADTAPDEVRAYMGYAGWSPGQLENEIARGDWIVMRGDPKFLFHADPDALWLTLIGAHGGLQAAAPPVARRLDAHAVAQ